jgi:hypothetical protein
MVHHIDIIARDKDEASAEAENGTSSEAGVKGMHAPLLRMAHLDLVFELRGQMADQEHRARLMGTCAQSFVIQAKATWKEDKGDRSPGI